MDSQSVSVDQLTTSMALIQEALTNLSQRMDTQQSGHVVPNNTLSDLVPPPPQLV